MRLAARASLTRTALAAALLLGALGALGPAAPLGAQGPRVLRIANAEPTLGTSPLDGGTSASTRVWELMHDGLWDRDQTYQPMPWLAESWENSADSKVWTFHLRDGLTFSDGSPITSYDVQASFNYLAGGKIWSQRLQLISSIDTPDSRTVVINFTSGVPEFLDLPGSSIQFSIFSKAAIDAGADWNQPMQVYSGPYMLKEYIPKDHLTLVKNPNYWRKDLPKFDQIDWTFNEDPTAGVAAIESGAADVYSPAPAKDIPRLRAQGNVTVYEANTPGWVGFGFDRSTQPFSDQRVRQAIGMTLDANERRDVCWFGTGGVLYGGLIFDFQPDWYNGITPFQRPRAERLAEAGQLLDQAGWAMGSDGRRAAQGITGVANGTAFQVDVPYEANWPASECHTQLLQNWGKQVGLTFNPVRYDPGRYWSDVTAGKFQMWHAGIPASPYAPDSLYQLFHTGGAWVPYWFRGSDPELDRLFDALVNEPDLSRKKDLLHSIEQRYADQQYMVSDGSQSTLVLSTTELQGFFARCDDSSRALILSDIPSR
jgi:peptide/nickel transport system substrate-binding protein